MNEGSAMAKSIPMNLVSHNFFSTRKNSPQDTSDSNNPGNAKAEQGGVSSGIWKLMREVNRKTLKMQTPGNRGEAIFRTHAASGNRCEVWRHTIKTWERSSKICKRSCGSLRIHPNLE